MRGGGDRTDSTAGAFAAPVSRRAILRGITGGLGGIALYSGLAGCSANAGSQSSKSGSSHASTITIGQVGDFQSFDPWFNQTENRLMTYQIFDPVVLLSLQTGQYLPNLATSWTYSQGGRQVTLDFRRGVNFQNGKELTADDIVLNIARARNANIGHDLYGDAQFISSARAVGKYSVEVNYQDPTPLDVMLDLFSNMWVISPDVMVANAPITKPVGTGPYTLASFRPGVATTFQKFSGYWKTGLPKTAQLVVKPYTDDSAMIVDYQAGALDIITEPPANTIKELSQGDSYVLSFSPLGAFYAIGINTTVPHLDNKLVRQALAHSVDRNRVVSEVFFGQQAATSTPFYEVHDPLYAKGADPYGYDVNKAKQLLAQAGVSSLSFKLDSDPAQYTSVAQIVQNNFAAIGVNVSVSTLQSAVGTPTWLDGTFQLYSTATAVEPRDLSYTFTAVAPYRGDSHNNSHWVNPSYQSLVASAGHETNPATRQALYEQLRTQIIDEMWCIPICTRQIQYALKTTVAGFAETVGDFPILSGITMSTS